MVVVVASYKTRGRWAETGRGASWRLMSLPDKKMSAPPAVTGETLASPEEQVRRESLG